MLEAFQPQGNSTLIPITSSGGSTAVQVDTGSRMGYRLVNMSSDYAYVAFGSSTVVATAPTTSAAANGFPMVAGAVETFNLTPNCWISAVTTGATGRLGITPGFGV
jgi:hypothetical protein